MTAASVVSVTERYDAYVRRRGDELQMLRTVAAFAPIVRVLYPGSYIHITPSLVFPEVVYVDTDRKAKRFFADLDAVHSLVASRREQEGPGTLRFHGVDYTDVPEPEGHFDLLVSLYAGFVSEACVRHLRPGGLLVANDSHGDASVAWLGNQFELVGTINGSHQIDTDNLDRWFRPRRGPVTLEGVRASGRGPTYANDASAYLFRRR